MAIQYNECKICGAKDGRAGLLIGNHKKGWDPACMNCHDTRVSGKIVIHSHLSRTDEEIQRTFKILDKILEDNGKTI